MQAILKTACGCRQVVEMSSLKPYYIMPLIVPTECRAYGPDEEVPRWWYDDSVPVPKDMFLQRKFQFKGEADEYTGLPLYKEMISND